MKSYTLIIKNFSTTLIFAIILFIPQSSPAFDTPETLHYRLSYANIKVGESILRIVKAGDNIIITSETNSSDGISILFNTDFHRYANHQNYTLIKPSKLFQ
jgi:hypothetical protein